MTTKDPLILNNLPQCIIKTTSNTPEILTWLPAFTPFVALIAAIIAYSAYKRQRRLHQEKLSHDFEAYYQSDKDLEEHRHKLNNLYITSDNFTRDLKLLADAPADDEYVISIQFVLNTWERCAHAIKEGLYDERYLFTIISSRALSAYSLLEPYIVKRISMKGKERAYINYRWLVSTWSLEEELSVHEISKINKTIRVTYNNLAIWVLSKRVKSPRKRKLRNDYILVSSLKKERF